MKAESPASDDELTSDVLSHYSSASESASVLEEGAGLYGLLMLYNSFNVYK